MIPGNHDASAVTIILVNNEETFRPCIESYANIVAHTITHYFARIVIVSDEALCCCNTLINILCKPDVTPSSSTQGNRPVIYSMCFFEVNRQHRGHSMRATSVCVYIPVLGILYV